MERRNIYSQKDKYRVRQFNALQNMKMPVRNKNLINLWFEELEATSVGVARRSKLAGQMRVLCSWNQIPFEDWKKADILAIAKRINSHNTWSDATKNDFKRLLRQFFKWLIFESEEVDTGKYARVWKEIRKQKVSLVKKKVNPEDIITEQDLNLLLSKGCRFTRDKALVAVLHEAGLRIEELLNMRKTDIDREQGGYKINVIGKTGERPIFLIISTPYLDRWLMEHPQRNEDDFLLWVGMRNFKKEYKAIEYKGATKILLRAMQEAGIEKPCNPHHFRHSRLTINGAFMSDSDLCAFAGWGVGSHMASVYVHKTYDKVRASVQRMRGVETEAKKQEKSIRCGNCLSPNLSAANFCACCGKPLTHEAHVTYNEMESKANQLLEKIMSSEKLLKEFAAWQKKTAE